MLNSNVILYKQGAVKKLAKLMVFELNSMMSAFYGLSFAQDLLRYCLSSYDLTQFHSF